MMINDFDDERTMDDEEGLSGSSCGNELDDLQREGDMPLEQLLAFYNYSSEPQDTRSSSEESEEILSNRDLTLDKDEIARDLLKNDDNDRSPTVNDLLDSVEVPSQTSRLLRSHSQTGSSDEDDEEDLDYEPTKEDDWKKVIQVGSDFQAVVPDGMCKYGDAPAYENEDRLLWDPNKMESKEVEDYVRRVNQETLQNAQGVNAIPTGDHIRDDEQALYLLLQCGHNVEEAIRRRKMQSVPPTDPMSLWSEEECRNFENGLRTYGKDFHLIQLHRVRTRSVGELVQFYYLWKKTERHDAFANKHRLEKRKYTLHPGVTDYMDRFLDDQENPTPPRDRSSSPGIHSLMYGDHKRHPLQQELRPVLTDLHMDPNFQPQNFTSTPNLDTAKVLENSTALLPSELLEHSVSQNKGENGDHSATITPESVTKNTDHPLDSNCSEVTENRLNSTGVDDSEPPTKRLKHSPVSENDSLVSHSTTIEQIHNAINHSVDGGLAANCIPSISDVHHLIDSNLNSLISESVPVTSEAMATGQ
ncbi:mesoderm induction early response protein 1-like isoform X2 [Lineus longissimus]|uniref:mesoderm induction early response protein 1-like isoform X2 n=1 Tax=Lineus longissimus TaxID=88925 RepID=UPI00315D6611